MCNRSFPWPHTHSDMHLFIYSFTPSFHSFTSLSLSQTTLNRWLQFREWKGVPQNSFIRSCCGESPREVRYKFIGEFCEEKKGPRLLLSFYISINLLDKWCFQLFEWFKFSFPFLSSSFLSSLSFPSFPPLLPPLPPPTLLPFSPFPSQNTSGCYDMEMTAPCDVASGCEQLLPFFKMGQKQC